MKRLALALLLALTGCGQVPGFQPSATADLRRFGDPADDLREALRKAYGEIKTLSGTVTYTELSLEDGKLHESVASFKTDVARRWIRAKVDKSDKPNARGAEMLFLNDGKVLVRVKIGPFPVTKTFPLDAPEVTSTRRYRLDQTDFVAMVGLTLDPNAKAVAIGAGDLGGQRVDFLGLRPAGFGDCLREQMGLDAVTHLPAARIAFSAVKPTLLFGGDFQPAQGESAGERRLGAPNEHEVFRAVLAGAVLNPVLPPATWKF